MATESLEQDCLHFGRVSSLAPLAGAWKLPQNHRHILACLPTVACVALGGAPEQAQTSQEVWALLFDSAEAFDAVQDDHVPPPLTPARAINVGLTLIFKATQRLGQLPVPWQDRVYPFLYETIEGQSEDVIKQHPTIQEALGIAEKKTGASFQLGCVLGALSAGAPAESIAALQAYGRALGTMVQIHDDLELVEGLGLAQPKPVERFTNVALAYAWEKLAPDLREVVANHLSAFVATREPARAIGAYEILVRCGARLFCAIEVARHWQRARQALDAAQIRPSPERSALFDLIDQLVHAFKAPP
ncbi:MAG: polyprenyl synthetase family protein [Anaerolineales bacterium]|nr:polyprenyl synthetase family protein [Anaerolineales bacterium]